MYYGNGEKSEWYLFKRLSWVDLGWLPPTKWVYVTKYGKSALFSIDPSVFKLLLDLQRSNFAKNFFAHF